MSRRRVSTYGSTFSGARVMSLLMTLAVLGALYNQVRDPNMWRWLAPGREARADVGVPAAPAEPKKPSTEFLRETIVEGPNDLDDGQMVDFKAMCRVIEDKKPLKNYEMPAYWKLAKWSRTQPFDQLEARARKDVVFTQMWQDPDTYRGKLIRMKVHVRRALVHPAPENEAGFKDLYELAGFTDESLSFPYFMILTEKPDGLDLGAEIEADGVFVGYFLKVMGYETFKDKRASPVLIGKLKLLDGARMKKVAAPMGGWMYGALAAGAAVVAAGFFLQTAFIQKSRKSNRLRVSGEVVPEELPTDFYASTSPVDVSAQVASSAEPLSSGGATQQTN